MATFEASALTSNAYRGNSFQVDIDSTCQKITVTVFSNNPNIDEEKKNGGQSEGKEPKNASLIFNTMASFIGPNMNKAANSDKADKIASPILDGMSGNVKHYRIYVSNDAKDWGEPVAEGEFSKEQSLQRVILASPVRARYIRFTALDSQNGRDYAGGSEFNILVE